MARSALLAVLLLFPILAASGCRSPVGARLGGNPILSKLGASPVPPQWEPEVDSATQTPPNSAETR